MGVHVLAGSGTPGDSIKLFSSTAVGMTSPVERFSVSAGTAGSFLVGPVTGVTNRYWRVSHTLTAPATFMVVFAVVA